MSLTQVGLFLFLATVRFKDKFIWEGTVSIFYSCFLVHISLRGIRLEKANFSTQDSWVKSENVLGLLELESVE